MERIFRFDTVNEYNVLNNHETMHPLVSVIDFSKALPRSWDGQKRVKIHYGMYCIFLKDVKCGDIRYGRNYYDYQEGTLVFTSPGQVTIFDGEMPQNLEKDNGWTLAFHSDLIRKKS